MNTSETGSSSDSERPNFENLKYNLVDNSDDILRNNPCDPDVNFFSLKTENLHTPYILPEEFQKFVGSSSHDSFSILHLNIRSNKENFENYKLFFSTLAFSFSVICFSETWLDKVGNSLYELPYYISKHQVRDTHKGGGVSIYIHNSLIFKVHSNLCINSIDIESLSIELSMDNKRNTFVNVLYRPPNGKIELFDTFLVKLPSSVQNANKDLHIAGDFNLNLLDHESNKKVHDFLNIIYRNGMIPTINKPTRVTRTAGTAIDYILTNSFADRNFKTAIFKSDVSDHFPISFIIRSTKPKIENKTSFIKKRIFNFETINSFKQDLYKTNWKDIETFTDPNKAYKAFLESFLLLCDKKLPIKKIKVKAKDLESPWITNGTKNSSKKEQRLYQKFLKTRTEKTESEYKNYKKLFESVKKRSKKLHFF